MSLSARSIIGLKAPEFPTRLVWLNSPPLTAKNLMAARQVLLIDFWTYSCVNCLNTLPYLKTWHERYADKGLVIVGVHTPEFEFEKNHVNVRRAIKELGVTYPVVMDNDYQIWQLYANRYWPRKLLIDTRGKIVYDHAGEGAYAATEKKIQELLDVEGVFPLPGEAGDGELCYRATPELYLGYKRGYVSNLEGFAYDQPHHYTNQNEHELDMWYLEGEWLARPEYVEYLGKAGEGNLILCYAAFSVNLVAGPAPGAPPTGLVIKQKIGAALNKQRLTINNHKMYPLISDAEFKEAELALIPQGPGLRLYAFTFGGCQ